MKSAILRGLKYGVVVLVISGLFGLFFGLFDAQFIKPALVSMTHIGLFVVVNFIISILLWLPTAVLYALKKSVQPLVKYIGISFGFILVFMPYLLLMKYLPYNPFA